MRSSPGTSLLQRTTHGDLCTVLIEIAIAAELRMRVAVTGGSGAGINKLVYASSETVLSLPFDVAPPQVTRGG